MMGTMSGSALQQQTVSSQEQRRILFLTTRFPYPPDRGDRLHAYQLIRAFAARFDVTVVAFQGGGEDGRGKTAIEDLGVRVRTVPLSRSASTWRLARGLLDGDPLQVAYYAEPRIYRLLERISAESAPFDAVVCHLIRTAPWVEHVRARRRLISLADSLSLSLTRRLRFAPMLERPSIYLEQARVRRFEKQVMAHFDEGWVVSEVDRSEYPGGFERIRAIPAGADEELLAGGLPDETDPVVGFLGHLSVPHNVDAAAILIEKIQPRLSAMGIPAKIRLIGGDPAPRIARLLAGPAVEWLGFVPNLASELRRVRVFCAPLRYSAGVQSKLVDALAAGVPVVTSPEAAQGLGPGAEHWVWIADSVDEYARAIAKAWQPSPERSRRLEGARQWVRERFRWGAYADRLQDLVTSDSSGEAD